MMQQAWASNFRCSSYDIAVRYNNAVFWRGLVFRAFFGQLFDAPAEIVVAQCRVVLAVLSLAAIGLNPTKPQHLAIFVEAILIAYAMYALVLLVALHWRLAFRVQAKVVHAVDI